VILFSLHTRAQKDTFRNHLDRDKFRYERIMKNETDRRSPSEEKYLHQYYLLPEELPEWFFDPSKYSTSGVFFIGISEPGMDSVKAIRLAVLRARSLALLSQKAYIDNISDNFDVVRASKDNYSEKSQYLDFSRVYTKSVVGSHSFKINKTFFTKYGEALALVSYFPGKTGKDTLKVNGEIMQLSRENSYEIENTVFCNLNIDYSGYDSTSVLPQNNRFVFKSRDNQFNITSLYNNDSIDFPVHPYRYENPRSSEKDSAKLMNFSLNVGLWNAYINLLFSEINYENRNLESKVKTSHDNYLLKNQGLIRTVSRNAIRFQIHSLALRNNELCMRLNLRTY
jgi:hypothetical protein